MDNRQFLIIETEIEDFILRGSFDAEGVLRRALYPDDRLEVKAWIDQAQVGDLHNFGGFAVTCIRTYTRSEFVS